MAAVFLSPHVLSVILPIVVSLEFSLRMCLMHHCWYCFCKWMIFCIQFHIHILSASNTSTSLPRYCFSATRSTAVFCLLWVFWAFQSVYLLIFRLYNYLCAVIQSLSNAFLIWCVIFLCSAIAVWLLVKCLTFATSSSLLSLESRCLIEVAVGLYPLLPMFPVRKK